jgi:hypothetical protein
MTVTIGLGEPGSTEIPMTPISNGEVVSVPSNISTGIATAITPDFQSLTSPGATVSDGTSSDISTWYDSDLPNVVDNDLEEFASCTTLWTLACLTPEQYNDPLSYRSLGSTLSNVIFSSAGRYDADRVRTSRGTPEYFINNFNITMTVAASQTVGNSNAINYRFDVYEPYSMGQFIESLQNAAINAGYMTYGEAVFVLKLEFLGYDTDGTILKVTKPKYFTVAFSNVKFKVTEAGSNYTVTAVPKSDMAYSDVYNSTLRDVKIIADSEGTVAEILKTGPNSLVSFLNNLEQTNLKDGIIGKPDVYDIQFPENIEDFTSIATATIPDSAIVTPGESAPNSIAGTNVELEDPLMNDIGRSKLGFTANSGGTVPMKNPDEVYNEQGMQKDGTMQVDPNNRAYQFPAGMRITDVITKVVLSSEYCSNNQKPENIKNGMIRYFMVDIQMEIIPGNIDPIVGDFAKKITFRVRPYYVHHSVVSPPGSVPSGYAELKQQICKAYNYIYTGKNTNVLKFDIELNNLFYSSSNSSPSNQAGKIADPNQNSTTSEELPTKQQANPGSTPAAGVSLRPRIHKDPNLLTQAGGGSGTTSTEIETALRLHNAVLGVGTADMITLNLEILGDPYWMVDNGVSNSFVPVSEGSSQMTQDGTMNYIDREVHIFVTFKTPVDVNMGGDGLYGFMDTEAKLKSQFSGIYQVIRCECIINDGMFKQRLTCVRKACQPSDVPDLPQPSGLAETLSSFLGSVDPSTTPNHGLWQYQSNKSTDNALANAIPDLSTWYKSEDLTKVSNMVNAVPGVSDVGNINSVKQTATDYTTQ